MHGKKVDLRTIPSAIGGDREKRRGVILAKSEPAKKFGIKTGEPIFHALKKCPNLIIVPPDHKMYLRAGNALLELLSRYSPNVQRFSIDEAFMEMDYSKDYLEKAKYIQNKIFEELGFTVNIGISTSKLLAKMASDFEKPNKIHTLFESEIPSKLWPLPVGDLFMVGRKTENKLNSRGIYTIGDLAAQDKEYISIWLKKHGEMIWRYANGIDESPINPGKREAKSIGHSTTTAYDVENKDEAHLILLGISEKIGIRMRDEGVRGTVIQLGIKDNNFNVKSRQTTLDSPTHDTNLIFNTAKDLFDELWNGEPIRLFSISVSKLYKGKESQLSFFEF